VLGKIMGVVSNSLTSYRHVPVSSFSPLHSVFWYLMAEKRAGRDSGLSCVSTGVHAASNTHADRNACLSIYERGFEWRCRGQRIAVRSRGPIGSIWQRSLASVIGHSSAPLRTGLRHVSAEQNVPFSSIMQCIGRSARLEHRPIWPLAGT